MITRMALWFAAIYLISGTYDFNSLTFWSLVGLIWASGLLGRIEGLELGRLECCTLLQVARTNLEQAITNFQSISGLEVPKLEQQEKKDD